MNLRTLLPTTLPALSLLLLAAPVLHAQVTNIPIFETLSYQQNDPTQLTPTGAYFSARIFETQPGDATAATLTYPGTGSPGDYIPASYDPLKKTLIYAPPTFANQAAMDAAFPTGTYTTDYTDAANNPQSVSVDYTQTAYASTMPTFTAATYNAMQGLDATQAFTFTFNADVPSHGLRQQPYLLRDLQPGDRRCSRECSHVPEPSYSTTLSFGLHRGLGIRRKPDVSAPVPASPPPPPSRKPRRPSASACLWHWD